MYHEEKVIDGILCWRSVPKGPWMPYTLEELAKIVEAQKLELSRFREHLNNVDNTLKDIKQIIKENNKPMCGGVW